MSHLLSELQDQVFVITLNRIAKHNAFDDILLKDLQACLEAAIANPAVRVIMLKAEGKHFSAGADLGWMQRMAAFSAEENVADAMILANVMHTLYQSPKPTIAVVQGAAYGGGIGLVAACDIAIASRTARFCFSEVRIGLIPAVISPYVVRAIGARAAKWLFMSADEITAERARQLQLVQYCVEPEELLPFAIEEARKIALYPPQAVADCKSLVDTVCNRPVDQSLLQETATLIANKRVSGEGQKGLKAFLDKQTQNRS